MRTSGYIIVTLKFVKEGRRWVAHCIELGTSTFGSSIQQATERIQEAVILHLNTLEDVGECERFLEERNVKFYLRKPKHEEIDFKSPLDPLAYFKPFVSPVHAELCT